MKYDCNTHKKENTMYQDIGLIILGISLFCLIYSGSVIHKDTDAKERQQG